VTTPLLQQTWTLGSLSLNTRDETTGVEWIVHSEEGWWSGPPRRLNHVEAPYADGTLRSRSYARNRTITLEGCVIAPSRGQLEQELVKLAGLCSMGGLETLTDGTYTTEVEYADRPDIVRDNSTSARYQISLIAPDPKKYGAVQTYSTGLAMASGGLDWTDPTGLDWTDPTGLNWGLVTSTGEVAIQNQGTAEAWPTFTVYAGTGTVITPKIRAVTLGREIVYGGTIGASGALVLTVDPLNRTVIADGTVNQRSSLTAAQWFAIPPGETITVVYEAAGGTSTDTTLTAQLSPAYW
jgi:hypothetical protein